MLYVLLPPDWLKEEVPAAKALQLDISYEEMLKYNEEGYNAYYYPNYPGIVSNSGFVKSYEIDNFKWLFVDFDLKSNTYASKQDFVDKLNSYKDFLPTKIVDSGRGIHAYWSVLDLNAQSYLRLQRRLMRLFNTDEAVCQIKQLMRVENTLNNKDKNNPLICTAIQATDIVYTAEYMDSKLPAISFEDEEYCKRHYDRSYNPDAAQNIDTEIPLKFKQLLSKNKEVKDIWLGSTDDRSASDFRLGHIMFASGFTKEEASSVLVNTSKALQRGPQHRLNYASNIVDKIWTFESAEDKKFVRLSNSVRDILNKTGGEPKGTRFPCWTYIDNTHIGFRLGHVIGLVGGSGVGKTTVALNMFLGFVQNNPDYEHLFVSLEQPEDEIASRWMSICGDNDYLHDKVQILGNYDEHGVFRDLSLDNIKDYIIQYEATTGKKIGCVVIDHIGVLANNDKFGITEGVKKLCKAMKTFAIQTNTLLVMQSQTSREKAGVGDLELEKDAAFGTSDFENYCDYLITTWQPIKRCYKDGAPTIQALKFCKIRHKKQHVDIIQEDVRYAVLFDSSTQLLRELTQAEQESFKFWVSKATNKRKADRKTEVIDYSPAVFMKDVTDGKLNSNQEKRTTSGTSKLHSTA